MTISAAAVSGSKVVVQALRRPLAMLPLDCCPSSKRWQYITSMSLFLGLVPKPAEPLPLSPLFSTALLFAAPRAPHLP